MERKPEDFLLVALPGLPLEDLEERGRLYASELNRGRQFIHLHLAHVKGLNKIYIYMKTEKVIAEINASVFFKEFTFSKNDFKTLTSKQRVEFADNVVLLDKIFFVYQIKDRNPAEDADSNWFENKVLKKAVNQIKNTLAYLKENKEIVLENARGHKIDIAKTEITNPRKIIIYTPIEPFTERNRFLKFYESKKVGLIHLFHSEDYHWICKYLITPTEIEEYFEFRERFYLNTAGQLNHVPEQYVLAHFIETPEIDHIDFNYIDNLKKVNKNTNEFDIDPLINNFGKNIALLKNETDYYFIIKEISKLNRAELIEFRKRLVKTGESCQKNTFTIPYRVYFPRTDCAFVFIPLAIEHASNWKNALFNLSLAQKYDQKAFKCIGLTMSIDKENEDHYFDLHWMYLEFDWKYDAYIEDLLKSNFPFRTVQPKSIDIRYLDDV